MHPDDEKIEASREPHATTASPIPAQSRKCYSLTVKKTASIAVIISILLMLAANGTQSWAKYTINGVTVEVGLYSTCIDDGQGCTYNDWSGYAICGLAPDNVRDRFQTILGFGLVGALCGLIYLVAAHGPRVKTGFSVFVRFASLIFFVFFFVTVLSLFVHTWNSWYFCGGDVCDYFFSIGADNCSWMYSYSLLMAAMGMPFAVIALFLNLVSLCRSRYAVDRDGKAAPTGAPADKDSLAPQQHEPTNKFTVPEGDWRFDPTSGFWWSDSHKLYFNDATGHYYDPEEQSWFDPETGEWS